MEGKVIIVMHREVDRLERSSAYEIKFEFIFFIYPPLHLHLITVKLIINRQLGNKTFIRCNLSIEFCFCGWKCNLEILIETK